MNKFNKKGFTLIEMLVVIAIIAVLVSIVIPVVGDSTAKAKAATDAANLRSMQATMTIKALTENTELAASGAVADAPACKTYPTETMFYTYNSTSKEVAVFFATSADATTKHDLAHFIPLAGGTT